jgi:hypothetical protein
MVVFPKNGDAVGDFIGIRIERANSATLFGAQIGHSALQGTVLTS